MFEGEKNSVFWLGLIILGLASIALFSTSYYTIILGSPFLDRRLLVPPILGTVVFILIGLYMMKSGTTKREERKTQLLTQ